MAWFALAWATVPISGVCGESPWAEAALGQSPLTPSFVPEPHVTRRLRIQMNVIKSWEDGPIAYARTP